MTFDQKLQHAAVISFIAANEDRRISEGRTEIKPINSPVYHQPLSIAARAKTENALAPQVALG